MKVIWFIVCTLVLATILLPLLPEQIGRSDDADTETAASGNDAVAMATDDDSDTQALPAPSGDTDSEPDVNAADADAEDTAPSTGTDAAKGDENRSELEQALAAATGSAVDNGAAADNAGAENDANADTDDEATTEGDGKLNAMEIDRSDPTAIPEGIPGVNAPLPTSPDEFPEGYDPLIHTPEFMEALKQMQEMAGESRGEAGAMAGSGTEEDPYRITWDLLLRAAQTYKPREDMREMPEAISKLNGKHVRISGYMLIPLGAVEFDEALLLMNMWDGCCIGLPPTAYDAVEVMLGESKKYETTRALSFGTVEGVLKVDPYEVSNWLVGLYIIEDAKVTEMM